MDTCANSLLDRRGTGQPALSRCVGQHWGIKISSISAFIIVHHSNPYKSRQFGGSAAMPSPPSQLRQQWAASLHCSSDGSPGFAATSVGRGFQTALPPSPEKIDFWSFSGRDRGIQGIHLIELYRAHKKRCRNCASKHIQTVSGKLEAGDMSSHGISGHLQVRPSQIPMGQFCSPQGGCFLGMPWHINAEEWR